MFEGGTVTERKSVFANGYGSALGSHIPRSCNVVAEWPVRMLKRVTVCRVPPIGRHMEYST